MSVEKEFRNFKAKTVEALSTLAKYNYMKDLLGSDRQKMKELFTLLGVEAPKAATPIKRYDRLSKISFSVYNKLGKDMNREVANEVIFKLGDRLRDYCYEKEATTARLIDLDSHSFWWERMSRHEVRGGWAICRFDIVDASGHYAENFNHILTAKIITDLQKIFVRKRNVWAL